MSMTLEEAIEYFKMKVSAREAIGNDIGTDYEAYKIAISALHPVSREQVQKVWRGEWHSHYKSGIHAGNGVVCSKCDMWNNRAAHFCPSCGAPMTDEAVQMVMERLEALKDGKGD